MLTDKEKRVFNAKQIAFSALIGTPLAAFVLLVYNLKTLGRHREASSAAIGGFAVTLLLAIMYVTSMSLTGGGLSALGSFIAVYYWVDSEYGQAFEIHIRVTRLKAPWWAALCAGIICLLVFATILRIGHSLVLGPGIRI